MRAAGREDERARDAALKATLSVMKNAGQPTTDAARRISVTKVRGAESAVEAARALRNG